ncbi:Transcriptional regulator, MarR family [Actinokineospora spheciospongiae]|uniref:Transcriptional regulator, MarR family n=1 Tax=Actinokineospora spheciospongiae TaxID=909613 RepID=W7IN87_9PSEU|nr:MarR family transcriptional regulator [Actinokineospora spheciospongiae]EWC58212.1 Transcriptional regulator, MarR family [Actinokineospora spheciospongiae]
MDHTAPVATLLRRIAAHLDLRAAEFAAAEGLHPTDLRALVLLLDARRDGHRATPGWLSTRLALNSASVTALVDRLAKAGYVDRTPDRRDRRRVLLALRDRGLAVGTRYLGWTAGSMTSALEEFDGEELRTAIRVLDRLEQAFTSSPSVRA